MDSLPPLNAVRAFEAAARHLSIKGAATELGVTPGAVSQQVRNLEDGLGLALFDRRHRGLVLTAEGQRYFPVLRAAFRHIAEATAELRPAQGRRVLTISCPRAFAALWLVPRLGRFQARMPAADVHVGTTSRLVDFTRERVDCAVRHGLGVYDGLAADRLLDDNLVPVCGPGLAAADPPLRRIADLAGQRLLHDESRDDWRLWLAAAAAGAGTGALEVDWRRGPTFSDSTLAIAAAIAGQGVALVHEDLVTQEVAAGRLVKPFAVTLRGALAYYLVYPPAHRRRPELAAFRDWILEEASL